MPEFLGVGVYFSDCSPVMANLRDVSTEVALEVIKYLDIYDLLSVALVSRRMRDVAQVEIFKNLKLAYLKGGADVDCNGQRLIKVLQDNLALRSHVRSLYLRFSSHNRGASLTTVLPLVNLRHIILCDRFSSVSPLVDYGSSLPILTQLLSYPSIQTITIHNHDESSTLSTTFTLDHSLDHSFPALHTLDTPPPNVTSALIAALARTCSGKISTTNVLVTSPWNAVAHLDDVNMLLAVGENTIETLNIIFPPSSCE
ncbi:hypothetical protein H0H81_003876 [Sphagnurus paluster]|uniref:F-box domain-containing protein n=1 Tax=Sphagnurus paluster TaxID=117069 RepID=A0A9P7KGD8_9AGAR|nr:hypothetical protein H0H81_003876 [Sphagnurus paluster]